MKTIDLFGILGALLFLLKMIIHVFIKRKTDAKFKIGAGGNFLNAILFLPIFDDVAENLSTLKKAANFAYTVAIVLLLIFLIGINIIKHGAVGQ